MLKIITGNPMMRSYVTQLLKGTRSHLTAASISNRALPSVTSSTNSENCWGDHNHKAFSTDLHTQRKDRPLRDKKSPPSSQPPSVEEVASKAPVSSLEPQLDKLYKSIELEVLAYEPSILDSYQWFVITAANHLKINVGKCWSPLKSDKLRFSLLKSAFVHKKHQVQYEVRTYHRFITLNKITESTADTFLEYIQRNLPEGVGLKVTKLEVKPLPESVRQK